MTSSTYSLSPSLALPFFSLFRRCANADETHWPVTAKAPSSQTRLGRVYNHVFSSKNDENLLCFWALSSVSEGSDNEGHGSHQIRPNRCFIDREKRGMILIELFDSFDADDIREMNGHADDEIKRQRLHYGSDQLYSVSFRNLTANGSYLQIVIV